MRDRGNATLRAAGPGAGRGRVSRPERRGDHPSRIGRTKYAGDAREWMLPSTAQGAPVAVSGKQPAGDDR